MCRMLTTDSQEVILCVDTKTAKEEEAEDDDDMFEDFANHNAFDLLEKHSKSRLVFNDDTQCLLRLDLFCRRMLISNMFFY
ncbi:NADP-dependent malic enzyme-like isoform X2 [Euphorbia lathyris]|uniref:NADP-dependent malic enzyme-like isoform X2 n=1 Tax=Euphorbia lathyris TaxID=212925 RepID=UPI0033143E9F